MTTFQVILAGAYAFCVFASFRELMRQPFIVTLTARQHWAYIAIAAVASLLFPITVPIGMWLLPKKDI